MGHELPKLVFIDAETLGYYAIDWQNASRFYVENEGTPVTADFDGRLILVAGFDAILTKNALDQVCNLYLVAVLFVDLPWAYVYAVSACVTIGLVYLDYGHITISTRGDRLPLRMVFPFPELSISFQPHSLTRG